MTYFAHVLQHMTQHSTCDVDFQVHMSNRLVVKPEECQTNTYILNRSIIPTSLTRPVL